LAAENPPKDFQDIMKSNGAIIDITLGIEAVSPNEQSADAHKPTSLRTHMRARDYDGVAADAAILKANFMKVEAFWTQRKVEDAMNFSKAAVKLAGDLEAAAKAKDDARISASASAIANTCRACHQEHRIMQLTDKSFQIM
jgi:cytochrome c556